MIISTALAVSKRKSVTASTALGYAPEKASTGFESTFSEGKEPLVENMEEEDENAEL